MPHFDDPDLPIAGVLPELLRVLESGTSAVLQAPPGAGKTTRVPLALLRCKAVSGRIVMLEPRRLAARAAARIMSELLGEPLGQTVGYRVRMESRDCSATRILVVTEGVLTRMIQEDPELTGIGCLIFDEFHERSLHADLGLTLALDCRQALREDLRILLMSATLDSGLLSRLLGNCPILSSTGYSWPVETRYLPLPVGREWESHVASVARDVLRETDKGVLVFLPGVREIRRVQLLLEDIKRRDVAVLPLYGDLPQEAQDAALLPVPPPRRKVVLATSIAETSLTIEGIDVVVDAGLSRSNRFDPATGMGKLVTGRVSRASADQRRGRAGRLGPGLCCRLWSPEEDAALSPFARPEILEADLAPLRLELALWGVNDPRGLRWLDAPPAVALDEASVLLRSLDMLDGKGRITAHGRDAARLGLHPRLAHMTLQALPRGLLPSACLLAALLEERDPFPQFPADVRLRLAALTDPRSCTPAVRGRIFRIRELAGRLEARVRKGGAPLPHSLHGAEREEQAGLLLALAYPDRLAQQRGGRGRFRMRNGRGAFLPPEDSLAGEPFLAVGTVDGGQQDARIRQAAPLELSTVKELFPGQLAERELVAWDEREQCVRQRRQLTLGALVLEDAPLTKVAQEEAVRAAVLVGVRSLGLQCLPWTSDLLQWRARVQLLRILEEREHPAAGIRTAWPDLSDEWLLHNLEVWLEPFLGTITRRGEFRKLALEQALAALLPRELARRLEKEAPARFEVPSGSRVALRYATEPLRRSSREGGEVEPPVLAVKLQELFGLLRSPTVGAGRVPVLVHLLSPAGRPLQVTRDLEGFWKTGYPAVRAEMRGRYPKHPWPEDPLAAVPTPYTTRKGRTPC